MRTRSAGTILPRNSAMVGNTTISCRPAWRCIAESTADGAIVGAIENQTALIVGEPDDEFFLLSRPAADLLFGDGLDAEFLLARRDLRLCRYFDLS